MEKGMFCLWNTALSGPCTPSLSFRHRGPGDGCTMWWLGSQEEHHWVHSSACQGPLFAFIFSQNPSGLTSGAIWAKSRATVQVPSTKSIFSSPLGKKLWTALLRSWGFVESCEIMYTEIQERWGLKMEGGCGINEAGGVKARGSRAAKICSQAGRQQNVLVLALYKVMSSEHVGVGRVHRFILIHCRSCQWGEGCRVCRLVPGQLSHSGLDGTF